MIWERSLTDKLLEIIVYEWEGAEHKQESSETQSAWVEGGRYTTSVPTDGSLRGAPGKYAAFGFGILQVGFDDHEGQPRDGEYGTVPAKCEGQKTFKSCEAFAMRNALGRAVSPLTILTSNFGVVQGLGRGDVHCTPDKTQMWTHGKIWRSARMKKKLDKTAVGREA